MKVPTHSSRLACQNPLAGWIARVPATVVFAALAVMLAACGDSGLPTVSGPGGTPDTSTLVGTWKGSVDGSYGFSVMTMVLKADSSQTMEAEKPEYCMVSGTWTVSSVGFTSTGRDCTGTIVSTLAVVNSLRLTGT